MTGPENGDKNREFKLFKPYIAMAQSYEKAGVNLEAGYEVVRRIKKHVGGRGAVCPGLAGYGF